MNQQFTSRSILKQYFEKNKIPTEEQFGAFIDTTLNQFDDGLIKAANQPLLLETGNNGNKARALGLYNHFSDPIPLWSLDLNPSGTVDGQPGNSPGFSIVDENEVSRFFIGKSGHKRVGISTIQPLGQLHVANLSGDDSPDFDKQQHNLSLVLGQEGEHNPGSLVLLGTTGSSKAYQRVSQGSFYLDATDGEYHLNKDPLLSNKDGVLRLYKKNSASTDTGNVVLNTGGTSFIGNELIVGNDTDTNQLQVKGRIKSKGIFAENFLSTSGILNVNVTNAVGGLAGTFNSDHDQHTYLEWKHKGDRQLYIIAGEGTARFVADKADKIVLEGGKVGIGTRTPTKELEVNGEIKSKTLEVNKGGEGNGNVATFSSDSSDHTYTNWYHKGARQLYIQAGGNSLVRIQADKANKIALMGGKVGIGTDHPLNELHVVGATRTESLNVYSKDLDGVATFHSQNGGSTYVNWYHKDSRQLYIQTANDDYVRFHADKASKILLSGGKVGIGTDYPINTLHVAGSTRTEFLYAYSPDVAGVATFHCKSGGSTYVNWFHKDSRQLYIQTANDDYVRFHADKASRIGITGGKVGIGTVSPKSSFDVYTNSGSWGHIGIGPSDKWGDGKTTIGATGTQYATLGDNSAGVMMFRPHVVWHSGEGAMVRFGRSGGIKTGHYWEAGVTSNNGFHIRNQNQSTSKANMYFASNGNVGIHTNAPAKPLHVMTTPGSRHQYAIRLSNPGSSYVWDIGVDNQTTDSDLLFAHKGSLRAWIEPSDGTVNKSSDRILKKNIQALPELMDKVMQLKPSTYQMKEDSAGKNKIGLIAQDVLELFPEMVGKKEHYGLEYSALGVIAIKAIQEQQSMIEVLKTELKALQNQLSTPTS